MRRTRKIFTWWAVFAVLAGRLWAFPTWMGVYVPFEHHDGGNPGLFTVLMNRDEPGLRARVIYRVDGGTWQSFEMEYYGIADGNSLWKFRPAVLFEPGSVVEYFFYGYETSAVEPQPLALPDPEAMYEIWDSRDGLNYSFTAADGPDLQWMGGVHHWPPDGEAAAGDDIWINMETWPMHAARKAEVLFTANGGSTWHLVPMSREPLGENDHWYVTIGRFMPGTEIQYALRVDAWGREPVRWANNSGRDYRLGIREARLPLAWVGGTMHNQLDTNLSSAVFAQSWPKHAGVNARLVYSLQGNSWKTALMQAVPGFSEVNDGWMGAAGPVLPGTIMFYQVEVEDGFGNIFVDPLYGTQLVTNPGSGLDSDADWIPDSWEQYWFSSTALGPYAEDPDHDSPADLPLDQYMEYLLGLDPTSSNDVSGISLLWTPSIPSAGGTLNIQYLPDRDATGRVALAWGVNGWQNVQEKLFKLNRRNGRLSCVISLPAGTEEVNAAVHFLDSGEWDNNRTLDWLIPVADPQEDLDGDGLPDAWERMMFGTAGRDGAGDDDADGLANYDEYLHGSHPLARDTDGDGLHDGWEAAHGMDPASADEDGNGIDDLDDDWDGDGFTAREEYESGTDPERDSSIPGMDLAPVRWRLEHPLRIFRSCQGVEVHRAVVHDLGAASTCSSRVTGSDFCCFKYLPDYQREWRWLFRDVLEPVTVYLDWYARDYDRVDFPGQEIARYDTFRRHAVNVYPEQAEVSAREYMREIGRSPGGWLSRWAGLKVNRIHGLGLAVQGVPYREFNRKGLVIDRNVNDTDGDGVMDCLDPEVLSGDPDFVHGRLTHPYGLGVTVTYDAARVRVYENQKKRLKSRDTGGWDFTSELSRGTGIRSYVGYDDLDVYIEGVATGTAELVLQAGHPNAIAQSFNITVIDPRLTPDYDRDGVISELDRVRALSNEVVHFWINDDDDRSADALTGKDDDVPGSNEPDAGNLVVDGMRDLLDFMPVQLDIGDTYRSIGSDDFAYRLRFEGRGHVGLVLTSLAATNLHAYHQDPPIAVQYEKAPVIRVASYETVRYLQPDEIGALASGDGIVLLEGFHPDASAKLHLEILRKRPQALIARRSLNLGLSGVEEMYRHLNLREDGKGVQTADGEPSNFPDRLGSEKNALFLHGFKVNAKAARGWNSEMFKRLYWSGSRARFWGVTWEGDLGLMDALQYQENVGHAFLVAAKLSSALAEVPNKSVLAHSLGNMVVSAAIEDHQLEVDNYFMLNAAVAIEAYDQAEFRTDLTTNYMVHEDWADYSTNTWSATWHQLFEAPDDRAALTWKNRFSAALANAHNFYSAKDEIFELYPGNPGVFSGGAFHLERYAWHKQEMLKGRFGMGSTDEAGWGFSGSYTKTEANSAQPDNLRSVPVFRHEPAEMLSSNIVSQMKNEILGLGIPALSRAAGCGEISTLPISKQYDMNQNKTAGFPRTGVYADRWLHSDLKDVAYPYTQQVFDNLILQGDLE